MQWLLAFRAAVGVGLGGGYIAFTLVMEVTPTHARVLVLVAVQAFWTVGTMFEVWSTLLLCCLSTAAGTCSQSASRYVSELEAGISALCTG